jgi:hypothetical protein
MSERKMPTAVTLTIRAAQAPPGATCNLRIYSRGGAMSLSELRTLVRELAGGVCQWPRCQDPGTEVAHLHSTGMGGRPSAHTLSNTMWACWNHARISDGEYGTGAWPQYRQSMNALLGVGWEERTTPDRWAYERAEALTAHLRRIRASLGVEEG